MDSHSQQKQTTINDLLVNKTNANDSRDNGDDSDIKGIIFDFDGVLSSFNMRLSRPLIKAALMVKPDITKEDIRKASIEVLSSMAKFESANKTTLAKFIFNTGRNFGMTNLQALKFIATTAIMYLKNRKNIVPLLGVRKVLQAMLQARYKIVLVTNASRRIIDVAQEKIPEIKQFDLILTRDDVDKMKPSASGFIKALKVLNLKNDEVIAIGDQASDIIAGKAAGIKTIAINNEMKIVKDQLKNHNPDFLIDDIRDLPHILMFLRDRIIEDIRTTIDLTEGKLQDYQQKRADCAKSTS
jgi:HAD superfamily hydrolase (TIGR01509 family)